MRMTWRDRVASVVVGLAVVAYAVWLLRADTGSESGIRAMVVAVLALGFVASASAVVPGFGELLHGSRLYLAVTSVLGALALAAGVAAFVGASTTMLAALVVLTVLMWVMATVRHVRTTGIPADVARTSVARERLQTPR